jgi:hypothetical protein
MSYQNAYQNAQKTCTSDHRCVQKLVVEVNVRYYCGHEGTFISLKPDSRSFRERQGRLLKIPSMLLQKAQKKAHLAFECPIAFGDGKGPKTKDPITMRTKRTKSSLYTNSRNGRILIGPLGAYTAYLVCIDATRGGPGLSHTGARARARVCLSVCQPKMTSYLAGWRSSRADDRRQHRRREAGSQ